MKEKHYYLIQLYGKLRLVYVFCDLEDGTYDVDMLRIERRRDCWQCSWITFVQDVKPDKVLAEVSEEDAKSVLGIMKETANEAAQLISADWKRCVSDDYPYCCTYDNESKYPYFTFMDKKRHENLLFWGEELGLTYDASYFAPESCWNGVYYEIPESVYEQAIILAKQKSTLLAQRFDELVEKIK